MTTSLPATGETVKRRVEIKPTPRELWHRYHAAGPGSAHEEELVKKYLPLVKTVVGRLAISLPPHVDPEELYSAGLVGLLNAVRQYKPDIGTAFEPYARLRIRGAILDDLRRMDWIPRSVHARAKQVQAAMVEQEQRLGRLPTDEEMAAALNLPVAEYERWLEQIRPVTFVCLDALPPSEDDEELSEHETMSDDSQPPASRKVERAELARLITERITQLPDLHRKVLALYYFEDYRMREIAAITGLCTSRVCKLHTQAILAIQTALGARKTARPKRSTSPAA
jgi:RNA polymerase sigma factor for flagellar operon FliA